VSPVEGIVVVDLSGIDRTELRRDRAGRPAQRTLAVLEEIERRWPDAGVELNYVYLGSQAVMGGPATLAEPSAPPYPLWPDSTAGQGYTVGVLDTGITGADNSAPHVLLAGRFLAIGAGDEDLPAENPGSPFLDRQGGHGTFVAGVLRKVAPGARLAVHRVLKATGESDIFTLVKGIAELRALVARADLRLDVLNLSLGGYTRRDRPSRTLAAAFAPLVASGTVIVAAAGNNASWRPFFPAAMADVVGVGALRATGRAAFSNFGPWVDACAPGVDVVSTFFDERAGDLNQVQLPPHPWSTTPIPARFPGFARWSGTSFAAPAVAGAIVEAAWAWQVNTSEAAFRLLRDWHRYRVPDLGVVLNVG
jgi:subtilisin family serine protease